MNDAIRKRCTEVRDFGTGPISDAMEGMKLRRTVITGWQFVAQDPTDCLVGPAFTMRQVPKSRAVPHDRILARHPEVVKTLAQPGDVIVVDNGGRTDIAIFGENLAADAQARGIAGFMVDGAIRDREWIRKRGFPTVSRGGSPVSSRWEFETISINEPVIIEGVLIRPGDIIYADADGVIVLAQEDCLAVFDRAAEIRLAEEKRRADLDGTTAGA